MAELYKPNNLPEEYDRFALREELMRIAACLESLEAPTVQITVSNVAPSKPQEGEIRNADGTNWDPGSGAGLYSYESGAWNKL